MLDGPRAQLAAAVNATRVLSSTRFSWLGHESPLLPPAVTRSLDAQKARQYLLTSLELQLYASFYTQGFVASSPEPSTRLSVVGVAAFVARLGAENRGRGDRESSGDAPRLDGQGLAVGHEGVVFRISNGEDARLPRDLLGLSPGYYLTRGDAEQEDAGAAGHARLYFNLTAEGAVRFVATATELLNREKIAFSLKVLKDPADYTRCDAGVLFLRKQATRAELTCVRRIVEAVASELKPLTPALTRPLAPGVGFAEDPGGNKSFGQHRCRIVAEGIWTAHELGAKSDEERLGVVEQVFAKQGLSVTAPHLNPGSDGGAWSKFRLTTTTRVPTRASAPRLTRSKLVEAAATLGERLGREALWHEGRCNWLGMLPDAPDPGAGPAAWRYSALGPSMYGGTAGVASFLSELFQVTRESAARDTARGAIRQALAATDSVSPSQRAGLYSGWLGIALVAMRLGRVLDERSLERAGLRLAQRFAALHQRAAREFDLLSGDAGAVVGCLELAQVTHDERWVATATRHADRLLRTADKKRYGYSWRAVDFPGKRNLTGLSHGAGGAACALLELYAVSGVVKYRDAARRAFDYEDHWFDAQAGSWTDLRDDVRLISRGGARSFATVWCHGAPGITVARLRAWQLTGDASYGKQAAIGLFTTRRLVREMLARESTPLSLCHGLTGNVSVALYGESVLDDGTESRDLAERTAARLLAQPVSDRSWLTGMELGDTPSLMLGRAGIGLFLLSLSQGRYPAVLVPGCAG